MSAFADLLHDAFAQGATHMRFDVDMERSEDDPRRWRAWAKCCSAIGHGRSGEEALRNLVAGLMQRSAPAPYSEMP